MNDPKSSPTEDGDYASPTPTSSISKTYDNEKYKKRKALRAVRLFAAAGRPRGTHSPTLTENHSLKALLESVADMHRTYASMRSDAARDSGSWHRRYTVGILSTTLAATVLVNTMQELDSVYSQVISTISFSVIAGLTSINNFLGYQKREEQHLQLRGEHLHALALIEIALAMHSDAPEERYDWDNLMEQLQMIHEKLQKATVIIPAKIAKKHPGYEVPWRIPEKQASWGECNTRNGVPQKSHNSPV